MRSCGFHFGQEQEVPFRVAAAAWTRALVTEFRASTSFCGNWRVTGGFHQEPVKIDRVHSSLCSEGEGGCENLTAVAGDSRPLDPGVVTTETCPVPDKSIGT